MKVSFAILLLLPIACFAQTFQGRVTNGTTGDPQPSSQVILLTAGGEQGRTTTNDSGAFRIILPAKPPQISSAVLRVNKDGVDYFQAVSAGQFVSFKVYQSASQVNAIDDQFCILQFQSSGKRLQVTELHALNNLSDPPVTRVNPGNFALSIPPGAQIESATVSSPDGGTSKVLITPVDGALHQYRIDFPIKPGITKYAIRYELDYDPQAFVFRRLTQYPMDRVGVIVPRSMRFRPQSPHIFHLANNAANAHEQQFELDKLMANAPLGFTLSGTGSLPRSFRPLQPGERPAPHVESRNSRSALLAHATVAAKPPNWAPSNSFFTIYWRTIALGMFLLAVTLAACIALTTDRRKRNQARMSSIEGDLSSRQGLSDSGQLAAQGRRH